MGVILLMIGYHNEPIATGSTIQRCNLLVKSDNTFKGNCIHKTLRIIERTDRDTYLVESKAFFVYTKRNEPVH